jgi:thioredoxin-dependent peroxiredoxin
MRRVAFWTLLCMGLAGAAWAQDLPDKRPETDPVPTTPPGTTVQEPQGDLSDVSAAALGSAAPEFVLDGSQGRLVKLADLKGKWAVLVFEGDKARLAQLQAIVGDLGKLGASLYGVSPDGAGALKALAASAKLAFPLLSDPTGEVAQLYGMIDGESGDPVPGLALLDPKGVVRALWTGPSLHAPEILQLVRHSVTGA